ncbi:2-dehydropantoate 2-reductase [Sphingosinicella soli]|uniref:2-dehydropantoate 2-reductase n=1 Tax=Sphingosinicella soli TaxID=333708 RepID=A0A7W7B4X6_9SPHN|nr:2-dehydropantoate 2-reductase [Sphingosinicella soli]MBB4632987.1 2-dehydropantoate 2-reductase [Sphingosinicella soli]
MHDKDRLSIAVMGAGLIGCYIGGVLAAGGARVTLIGRPAYLAAIRANGLRVSDASGRDTLVAAEVVLTESPAAAAAADVVLITVKSDATAEAAAALAPHIAAGTPVLSLQNGADNVAAIAAALPEARAFAGMVPFSVAERGPGHFHQATGSPVQIGTDPALDRFADALTAGGLPPVRSADMDGVLWGKLLVNLNNAINALSGKTLAQEFADRDYRRAWALSIAEALDLLKAAGIRPASVLPLPVERMPLLLSLPNFLYRRIAARQKATVDRHARTSMADDLARGRRTEVDHLNGAVVRLAERLGRKAPVNAKLVELMRAAEAGAPPIPGKRLRQALAASTRA